jgi:hypothetical protein
LIALAVVELALVSVCEPPPETAGETQSRRRDQFFFPFELRRDLLVEGEIV